jgi:hypothetical protein
VQVGSIAHVRPISGHERGRSPQMRGDARFAPSRSLPALRGRAHPVRPTFQLRLRSGIKALPGSPEALETVLKRWMESIPSNGHHSCLAVAKPAFVERWKRITRRGRARPGRNSRTGTILMRRRLQSGYGCSFTSAGSVRRKPPTERRWCTAAHDRQAGHCRRRGNEIAFSENGRHDAS